jgi:hypothetical protein
VSVLGAIIMGVSITSVVSLTVFCLWRVLSLPPAEVPDLHAPLDSAARDGNP